MEYPDHGVGTSELEYEVIYLNTEDQQIFYTKLGYQECGTVPIHGFKFEELWEPVVTKIVNSAIYKDVVEKYFCDNGKSSEEDNRAMFPEEDLPNGTDSKCDKNAINGTSPISIPSEEGIHPTSTKLNTIDSFPSNNSVISSNVPKPPPPPPPPFPNKCAQANKIRKNVMPPTKIDNLKDKIGQSNSKKGASLLGKTFMSKYIAD